MNGQSWLLTLVSWQPVDGSDQSQKAKGMEQLCLKVFFPPCASPIFHIHQKHTTFTCTLYHRQGFVEENLQSLVPALDNVNEVNGKEQWRRL